MATRFYRCRNCHFLLDVKRGVTEDQAMGMEDSILRRDAARESIDDVPLMWRCPMCQSDRDSFDEFEEGGEQLRQEEADAPQEHAPSSPADPSAPSYGRSDRDA